MLVIIQSNQAFYDGAYDNRKGTIIYSTKELVDLQLDPDNFLFFNGDQHNTTVLHVPVRFISVINT